MADNKFLYEQLSDKMREYRLHYSEVPNYITDNVKYNLFDWQQKALEYFLDYQQVKEKENPNTATHLLFNMATGTGKTLVMASLILYYYKQGYRHFLFFVNQNNIVGKTENNLLDPTHNKYLFKDPIVIDDKTININKVDTFSDTTDDIEIIFTSIHKLHNAVYQVKENAIFLDDLQNRDIVMLADEAHHLNSDTKTKAGEQGELEIISELKSGANAKEVEKSWEHTVTNLILQRGNKNSTELNKNVLLEFTATVPTNANIVKKYIDKIVYKFELKDFLKAGYTKEINLVSSSFDKKQRVLQALLFNWYRYKMGLKYNLPHFKPVILFRSKFVDAKQEENVGADYELFRTIVDDLSTTDFAFLENVTIEPGNELYKKGQSRIVDIANYLKSEKIHHSEIITYLQDAFKDNNCIITHSKEKVASGRRGEDKTTPEQDQLLNSLEDKTNKITAIFTCMRLTEGWDVLNLYDIVRMYSGQNTGGTNKKKAGKSTVSEVQLIGRGVRYYPFSFEDNINNKRKFDKELNHELRVLEEFYFHSDNDEKYISELKLELKRQELLPEKDKQLKIFDIKKEIKDDKNSFYHKLKIYKNEFKDNPNKRKRTLEELKTDWEYNAKIETIAVRETNIKLEKEEEDITRYATGNSKDGRTIPLLLKDFPKNIVYKALHIQSKKDQSILRFNNLKNELAITSINEIFEDKYIGNFSLSVTIYDFKEEFNKCKTDDERIATYFKVVSPKDNLNILSKFFEKLVTELKRISKPRIGTDFSAVPFKYYFQEPKQISVQEDAESYNLEKELVQKDWYVLDAFYGTSEEKSLISFLKGRMDNFKDKYDEVYLLRNEEVYKIYNFEDGTGFMPDFLLFLKTKEENLYYQVFIEPKGGHLLEKDKWKGDFLNEITEKYNAKTILKEENKNYRLVGLPLYNKASENVFKQSVIESLNIQI
ncbi:DEAD/DEAH box helicase family protein [Tenacibaculum haliotis]|uniref:DEAD/DEAH box helicase family protein n=1 Tax=Tenacibaculum haliotis TaxID=1888914 RepID=UPI0021AE860A|nr:DEAD/DEAH box helicase family protein [Tenacibaculum haliotis]MCT4698547.1 DEAD/DEAH box helicase family protein [Tenacibaculum haliotis]